MGGIPRPGQDGYRPIQVWTGGTPAMPEWGIPPPPPGPGQEGDYSPGRNRDGVPPPPPRAGQVMDSMCCGRYISCDFPQEDFLVFASINIKVQRSRSGTSRCVWRAPHPDLGSEKSVAPTEWNTACFPEHSDASGSHFTKLLSMCRRFRTWQLCLMSISAVVVQFFPAARWSAVLPFSIAASTSAPASSSRYNTSRHCGMNDRPVSSCKGPTLQHLVD